jgi:RNA processing factor Prp31
MRNISQHKPKNISIFINHKSQLCLTKTLLFHEYKISNKIQEKILNLLPEEIDLLLHINTFFMNILEMKEWIFSENIDIKNQERFFKTISKYKLNKNTYIRKKYENGNIDYLVLTSNFKDVVGNSIDIYNEKFSVIGKKLGHDFNYINYFEQ